MDLDSSVHQSTNQKHTSDGHVLIAVAVAFIVGVAITLAYFVGKSTPRISPEIKLTSSNQIPPSNHMGKTYPTSYPTNTTTNTSTANWKTYMNDQFHYQILYPSDWSVKVMPSGNIGTKEKAVFARSSTISDASGLIKINIVVNYQGDFCCQVVSESKTTSGVAYKKFKNDNGTVYYYFGDVNGNNYLISTIQNKNEQLVDQIISTFKFTQ